MPTSFDIISRLMVVLAIAIVVVPLMRLDTSKRVWPSVALAALFVYLGSALVYPKLSNWHWPVAGSAAPVVATAAGPSADQIAQLQAAAQATPDSPEAWGELASALLASGEAAGAVPALERVFELTGGANVEWTLLLVDALMMSDDGARERVSTLVEQMLQTAPDHPKALYYGAELAFSRNELALARTRWQRLLVRAEQDSSEEARNVSAVLEKRIAMVSERLGDASVTSVPAPNAGGPALEVTVSLAAEHLGSVPDATPVFILARDGPGPPVAVVRRSVADLPVTVTLTDANAMLPSRRLSNFDSVEVVARVALGGSPTAQSGDIFGSVNVATSRTEPVRIAITDIAP
ncbi:MAG: tetratricopeptide repeat protein [Gammaproteobacteria bacterium]